MIIKATWKKIETLGIRPPLVSVITIVRDVFASTDHILKASDEAKASLITIQRVLYIIPPNDRLALFHSLATLLKPDGFIIVDVPHPDKHIGGF